MHMNPPYLTNKKICHPSFFQYTEKFSAIEKVDDKKTGVFIRVNFA